MKLLVPALALALSFTMPAVAQADTMKAARDRCSGRAEAVLGEKADWSVPEDAFCAGTFVAIVDNTYAHSLFLRAAEAGYAPAQYEVGNDYQDGIGVEADIDRALEWLLKAAEQGLPDAQNGYAFIYFYGEHGVAKDPEKAIPWFQKAADQDYTHSITLLAEAYYEGTGVAQDTAKAFALYTRAANLGHPFAKYMLGVMYLNGQGTAVDGEKAMTWLTQAAEAEIGYAMLKLASHTPPLADGSPDLIGAMMWYDIYETLEGKIPAGMEAMTVTMTPEQVDQAWQRADAWISEHHTRAD